MPSCLTDFSTGPNRTVDAHAPPPPRPAAQGHNPSGSQGHLPVLLLNWLDWGDLLAQEQDQAH